MADSSVADASVAGSPVGKKFGHSLIELMVALSILVLLFSFIPSKQKFFSVVILQNEVDRLFSVCSYLQQKAIASNTKQELTFAPEAGAYSYRSQTGGATVTHHLANPIQFGYIPNSKGPPATQKTVITKAITFRNRITFFPNGNVSSGTVYFTDRQKKAMKALTCSISQLSCIRLYSYKNNKWVID